MKSSLSKVLGLPKMEALSPALSLYFPVSSKNVFFGSGSTFNAGAAVIA